jgi:hypothetical protein
MTKSPRRVAREALQLAHKALPAYSCPTSRHDNKSKRFSMRRFVLRWDRVLGDAAFDAEHHHRLCREDGRIRSMVILLDRRGHGRKWPKAKYRRQMRRRCPRRVYGQRWQAESAFSRHKRLLGSALRSRSDAARERECFLRVLTPNVVLLAAAQ